MSPRSQVQRPTKFFIIEELTWQFNGKLNFFKALKLKKFFFQQMILEQMVVCACAQLLAAATTAKSLQSCLTLCDPRDRSPPGSPIPGIPQARTLEWVAISFSNAWNWKVKVKSLSHVWLLVTPWTATYQAPPSMGFSGQEYRSGVPLVT